MASSTVEEIDSLFDLSVGFIALNQQHNLYDLVSLPPDAALVICVKVLFYMYDSLSLNLYLY